MVKRAHGFSLLELIIVLVIIGVIVAAISISITDTRRDKLHFEVRRLAARLSLARDEAILTNQELGLEVESNSYRFLSLNEEAWKAIGSAEEKQLVEQLLPEEMEIQLKVGGLFSQFTQKYESNKMFREKEETDVEETSEESDSVDKEEEQDRALRPQIYLMSSGELNPFTLVMGYDDETPVYYLITASFEGKITTEGPFDESMSFALAQKDYQ